MPRNTVLLGISISVCAVLAVPAHAALTATDLSVGSQGSQVTELQTLLSDLGYYTQKASGYFDKATQLALTAYQQNSGMAAVGSLTPQTSTSLNAYSAFKQTGTTQTAVSSSKITRTLSVGSSNSDVTLLQLALIRLGYLKAAATGTFGNQTKTALMAFQSLNGFPATGVLDTRSMYLINTSIASMKISVSQKATTVASTAVAVPLPKPVVATAVTNTNTASLTANTSAVGLHLGSTGTAVTALQQSLSSIGLLSTAPTAYFGTVTQAALKTFQQKYNLPVTGAKDTATQAKLTSVLALSTPSNASGPAQAVIQATKVASASGSAQINLQLSSQSVTSGNGITITWNASNVSTCSAQGDWSGSKPTSGSASIVVIGSGTHTYTLTCSGPQGNAQKSQLLSVLPSTSISSGGGGGGGGGGSSYVAPAPVVTQPSTTIQTAGTGTTTTITTSTTTNSTTTPSTSTSTTTSSTTTPSTPSSPTVNFTASSLGITSGASVTFTWSSTNATSCTASMPGWNTTQPTSGSLTVPNITATQTYTLTCSGSGGSISQPLTVTVQNVSSSGLPKVGMNLQAPNYWIDAVPFIDRFKTANAGWSAQYFDGTPAGTLTNLDANGYPLSIPSNAQNVYTILPLDPLSASTSPNYVVTYSGTGDISVGGGSVTSKQPGRIEFTYVGDPNNPSYHTLILSIASSSPTDHLRDIHVFRKDQEALFNSGEVFNPAFIAKTSQWSALRFMDWGGTNDDTTPVHWNTREQVTNETWDPYVPLEIMVKLANESNADMWYNIPAQADDDYVRNALAYIRDNLNPAHKLHLEYSNEVWNWGFPAAQYASTMADTLWGVDANHDGHIDPNDPAEHVAGGWLVYYGYRSAQIAAITDQVFGASSKARVANIISTQTAYHGIEPYVFQGIAKANVGSTSDLFEEYAITNYFSAFSEGNDPTTESTVLGWANSGDAGITAALHELQYGGLLGGTYSVANVEADNVYHAAIAAQYGLKLVVYEGNFGVDYFRYPAADKSAIHDFIVRLDNDPRMGQLYEQVLRNFGAAGGTLFMNFNDVGTTGEGGAWGVLDTIYQNSSQRYDALARIAAAAGK